MNIPTETLTFGIIFWIVLAGTLNQTVEDREPKFTFLAGIGIIFLGFWPLLWAWLFNSLGANSLLSAILHFEGSHQTIRHVSLAYMCFIAGGLLILQSVATYLHSKFFSGPSA